MVEISSSHAPGPRSGRIREAKVPTAAKPTDATTAILTERGSRYGKFEDHARIAQILKFAMQQHTPHGPLTTKPTPRWASLADDQKEALEMIAHKIGRILNGDPDYADSWADIAGYARLVADRLEGVSR